MLRSMFRLHLFIPLDRFSFSFSFLFNISPKERPNTLARECETVRVTTKLFQLILAEQRWQRSPAVSLFEKQFDRGSRDKCQ